MSKERVQELTDEMAAALWSGGTASIAGFEEPAAEEEVEIEEEEKEIDPNSATPIDDDQISSVFAGEEIEDVEPDKEDKNPAQPAKAKPVATPGRKPSDLVTMVNQLVAEDILLGLFNEKDELIEVKTIDEAKALIKDNLAEKEKLTVESIWEDKVKSYSPQIQTILKYAEQGAQSATELLDLMQNIKEVEDANEMDIKTKEGQISVIREAYKAKGFKDAYIDKNIKRLEDLDALEEEAQDLSQELIQLRANQVRQRLSEQSKRQEEAAEAAKSYFKTIQDTLSKDQVNGIKLAREDKAKIYKALIDDRYTSLSGSKTNEFVKTLEDLQFGKDANYEHFLSVVQYTVDPKGFIEKLKASVKNEVTEETVKRLKSSRQVQANSDVSDTGNTGRKGIKKTGFKNPFE